MGKVIPSKPALILLYGFSGAGKTYFARQFSDAVHAVHIEGDRIRAELFDKPKYDKQENKIVEHLANYMAEEFLKTGISVVYDINAASQMQRHRLREMARRHKAKPLLVWFQVDPESCFARATRRDRRKSDDKYAADMTESLFKQLASSMQNPVNTEDYVVISGKHTFNTQYSAVARAMRGLGLLEFGADASRSPMPGLVNLVPDTHAGRVDMSRRQINIR